MYGIFTYIWLIIMVNVGKYTSPMDPMGKEFSSFFPGCWHTRLGCQSGYPTNGPPA